MDLITSLSNIFGLSGQEQQQQQQEQYQFVGFNPSKLNLDGLYVKSWEMYLQQEPFIGLNPSKLNLDGLYDKSKTTWILFEDYPEAIHILENITDMNKENENEKNI
jgi:hypothetical protein